ncbi:hypothetical protein EYF80_030705 [Liparis tanakae]|uniref:Uncharacterized protein n=1 Tax=Liparis tanakae TaxID=230148 RepID=A0A4Z2H0F5_9TELE|nr:hypothetical protein EYF80_030705 [Liparis tanakae]
MEEIGDDRDRNLGVRGDGGGGLPAPGRQVLRRAGGGVRGRGRRSGGGRRGVGGNASGQHHGVQLADVGGETVNHAADLVHDSGALGLGANHPYADVAHAYDADVPAVRHSDTLAGVPASPPDPSWMLSHVGGDGSSGLFVLSSLESPW